MKCLNFIQIIVFDPWVWRCRGNRSFYRSSL